MGSTPSFARYCVCSPSEYQHHGTWMYTGTHHIIIKNKSKSILFFSSFINTCSCISWQVSSKCRPTGNNTYIHSCMYTLHQVKVLVQLLSKKRILGLILLLYIKFFLFWYKDLQKVVILVRVTWFTFGFCLRPEKIYWMGKTQKSVCCCCCYDPLKNTAKRLLLLLGFFFLSFFFLFLLLRFEKWCVQNLLFLFLSLNFKTYLFFCPSHSSVMFK